MFYMCGMENQQQASPESIQKLRDNIAMLDDQNRMLMQAIMNNPITPQYCIQQMLNSYVITCNVPCKKKEKTIYEIIFPNDPIQKWADEQCRKIDEKYKFMDDFHIEREDRRYE